MAQPAREIEASSAPAPAATRFHAFDSLRAAAMLLGISFHAAISYVEVRALQIHVECDQDTARAYARFTLGGAGARAANLRERLRAVAVQACRHTARLRDTRRHLACDVRAFVQGQTS